MGRKVMFSAMLAAGLVQMAPAIAQQDKQQDVKDAPAEAAAPAPAPEPESEPVAVKAEPAPAVAEAKPRDPDPAGVPVASARPREPDLAERDLATAPPEELPPVRIDPNRARHGLASLNRPAPAAERKAEAEPVRAEPVKAPVERVADARPAPRADDRDAQPEEREITLAERIVQQAQAEHDGDAALARSARAAEHPLPAPIEQRRPEPAMASAEESAPAPGAADEARDVAEAPVEVARDVASATVRPVFAGAGRRALPDLAEERENGWGGEDRAADRREERAGDDGDARDAYPEREAAPVYAGDDGYGRPTHDGEDRGYDGVYQGRGAPAEHAQVSWPNRNRYDDRNCDNARAVALQQRVRREAARGLIDRRAARDIDDEIVGVDDLHRSYCATGMNDWREERLERQLTEIENRLRFEEERYAGAAL